MQWLTPYEFTGFWQALWYGNEGTEGYVITSAEEAYGDSYPVMGLHLKYIPSATLNNNLHRRIYFKYPEYWQETPVFQLDDSHQPIYVTMMTQPAFWGVVGKTAKGVVITNPQTGQMQFYDMDKIPSYVERTIDEGVIEQYLSWWGKYIHGFWNSFSWGSRLDVKKPTGGIQIVQDSSGEIKIVEDLNPDVYLIYGNDNHLYWFSAISTPSSAMSMVGYILVDAKSWPLKSTFYAVNGDYNDISAAGNIQQDGTVSNTMGYHTTQPIMYHLRNHPVWIAAVLSSQNEIKKIGLVDARNGKTYVADTKEEVIAKFLADQNSNTIIANDTGSLAPPIDYNNMTNEQLISIAIQALKTLDSRHINL